LEDTLYIVDSVPKIYKATDHGNTWNVFANFSGQAFELYLSGYDNNLFVFMSSIGAYYSAITKTSDNGATWQTIYLSSSNLSHITVDTNLIVIANYNSGTSLLRINDAGTSVINAKETNFNGHVGEVAFKNNLMIYGAIPNLSLQTPTYLSTNSGQSFTDISNIANISYLKKACITSNRIFLTNNGYYNGRQSADGGNTWLPTINFVEFANRGDTVYAYDIGYWGQYTNKVYRSFNGGISFDSTAFPNLNLYNAFIGKQGIFFTLKTANNNGLLDLFYWADNAQTISIVNTINSNTIFNNSSIFNLGEFANHLFAYTLDTLNNSIIHLKISDNFFATAVDANIDFQNTNNPFLSYMNKFGNSVYFSTSSSTYLTNDGYNWGIVNDMCVDRIVGVDNNKMLAIKGTTINQTYSTKLYVKTINNQCNASFTLLPDTNMLHHWFAINNSSGVGPLSFSWNWGDGSLAESGINLSHTYSTAGYYNISLTLTDASGCSSIYCDSSNYISRGSNNLIISVSVVNNTSLTNGFNANNYESKKISIFPNPTTSSVYLTNTGNKTITITNITGQNIYTKQKAQATETIDLSNISKGIYFVKVGTEVRKILKE